MQEEVWRVKRLVLLVEHAVEVGEWAQAVAADVVGLESASREDGVDEGVLVAHGHVVEQGRKRGERPAALGRPERARSAGDGRGVEPPREEAADWERGPQPAADRVGEELAKRRGVLGVGAEPQLPLRIERPVLLDPHSISSHRHLVRRGQAQDVLVERDCPVFEQREEVVRHAGLVQPHRDLGEREQALDLRGKREQPIGAVVIVERLHPEVIARAEQHLPTFVPDREREVSQQVLRAALSPALVGGEEQLGVRDRAGSTEHGAEIGAVVNPRVGREDERAVRAREREALPQRLGCCMKHHVPQGAGAGMPEAGAVGPAVGEPGEHALDIGPPGGHAVEAQDPGDPAHRVSSPGSNAGSGV